MYIIAVFCTVPQKTYKEKERDMMKIKKILSFISAVAVATSAFAGLGVTANAAVGDVLYSQNFSANDEPWGAPVAQFTGETQDFDSTAKVIGTAYVDSATLTDAPATVTDTVFNFSTDLGNNGYTGTVSFDDSVVADAYEISFDTYVKNAMIGTRGYELNSQDDPTHYTYRYSIGDGSLDTAVFGLSVTGGDISIVSGGETVDTGIDTGDTGIWVNVSIKVNIPTHKMTGTITPATGSAYSFNNISTSGANAAAISSLFVESIRYSGSEKGYANNYIDNLVIKEAAATEAGTYTYEIIAQDTNGAQITSLEGGSVTEGTVINYANNTAMVVDGKGYVLADDATLTFSVDEDTVKYVTYKEADGAAASYGFTSATDPRLAAQNGGTVSYVTDDTVGTAMAYTSNDAAGSKLRYVYFGLSEFISPDYQNTYISFDSMIPDKDGRMVLSLRGDTAPASYSDRGYFWIGTSDGNGYRVNGTQKAGGSVWVHANYKLNTKTNALEYLITNIETGAVVDRGTVTLADTPLYLGFLSHSQTTANIANLTIVQDGFGDTSDARFNFEDENTAFKANGHTAVAIEENSDNGTNVLKFTSDSGAGESAPAVASLDISKYTFAGKSVKVEYDTYVSGANVIFGVSESVPSSYSETNTVFSHGYRSSKGYYVIYGESGSAYTALNGQWVHATVEYDADADKVSYTLKGADGTTRTGTKSDVGINALNYVYVFSGAADTTAYVDNVAVYTERDYIDLTSAKLNGHGELVDMGEYMAVMTDANTGASTPATGAYDISAITENKSNILISYDSYVYSGSRSTFGVDDIFSQGWGSKDYYIINGESGSGYTFAADAWVRTQISIDLNEGTYKYTVSNLDGAESYSSKGTIEAKEVKAIVWKSTMPEEEAYINNISVRAYGELQTVEYTVYEAVYMEDGSLDYIVVTKTTDPDSYESTEGGRVFIWDETMKPYKK